MARRWWWFVALGVVLTLVGVWLLASPFDSAATLALLVALGVGLRGVDLLVNAGRYEPTWAGYVLGTIHLATGLLAAAWPGVTLWALAVVVGCGLVVSGLTELWLLRQFHHDVPRRGLFALLAVVTVAAGVLGLLWPAATVVVLAIVFGAHVLVDGITHIAFGLGLRQLGNELAGPGEPASGLRPS